MDKMSTGGGREIAILPGFDTREPDSVARFCLGLGYSREVTVNTVQTRCSLDPVTAISVVTKIAREGGH
jgi:hypothetical protein